MVEAQQNKYQYDLIVQKEMFYNDESMWGVYSFKFANPDDEVTSDITVHETWRNFVISGEVFRLTVGETYTVEFEDSYTERYGNGYAFIEVKSEGLTKRSAQVEFLQTVLPPTIADDINFKFPNNDTLLTDIMEKNINLLDIKGITENNIDKYLNAIGEFDKYQKAIVFLAPIGVSIKAIKRLSDSAGGAERLLQIINKNIYALTEFEGFGFRRVDDYALKLGYKVNDSVRLLAGAEYVLEQMSSYGDIKIPIMDFDAQICKILDVNELTDEIMSEIIGSKKFYYDDGIISLTKYRNEEIKIADRLVEIQESVEELEGFEEALEEVLQEQEEANGFRLTDEQTEAVKLLKNNGIAVINGVAGSGKCVRGDTLVSTDKGLIKIEEIPEYFYVNPSTNESEAKIISYDTLGNKYSAKKTSHWFNMGLSATKKITTNYGREIEGTPEHPLLIINRDSGELEYKKMKDLQQYDALVLSHGDQNFGNLHTVSEDVAWAIGVILGDGHITPYLIQLTNGNPDIYLPYREIMENQLNISVKNKKKDRNSWAHNIIGKKHVNSLVEKYKIPQALAKHKEIPSTILQAPKNVVVKFLQGLFDTDGSMPKRIDRNGEETYYFEFSTASSRLNQQLLTVLLNLGILASARVKPIKDSKGDFRDYYILTISDKHNLNEFYKQIGFLHHKEKQRRLKYTISYLENINSNTNKELVFGIRSKLKDIHNYMRDNYGWGRYTEFKSIKDKRLSSKGFRKETSFQTLKCYVDKHRDKPYPHKIFMENIVNNLHFELVDKIEDSSNIVYDFTVPETHSFVANGIINHNTAITKSIVEVFNKLGKTYHASALSGKASQVLVEKGITNSSTIHRMLRWAPQVGFTFDLNNPLPNDLIIIDEASMNNNTIFLAVINAVKKGSRLLLIGDSGQLPPIGHGALFETLLKLPEVPRVELTKVHRQAAKSGVIVAANDIRKHKQINEFGTEGLQIIGELEDMRVFNYNDKTLIYDDLMATVRRFNDNPSTNSKEIQVLTAMKKGVLGVPKLNEGIQNILNPHPTKGAPKPSIKTGNKEFRVGDRVIQTGNFYDATQLVSREYFKQFKQGINSIGTKDSDGNYTDFEITKTTGVFNGTIGYIVEIVHEAETGGVGGMLIEFETTTGLEYVFYHYTEQVQQIGMLDLAYAITVHRSQGSGFKTVLFAFDYSAYMLLSKEFVYTGITRTINHCLMFVENSALHHAIKNTKSSNRKTYVADFLQGRIK